MRKVIFTFLFFCFSLSGFVEAKDACCCNSKYGNKDFKKAFLGEYSLEKQNFVADLWKLQRFENELEIKEAVRLKKLVSVPSSTQYYFVDSRLDKKTHFVSPWTLIFIDQLSKDFYERAQSDKKKNKKKIKVASLVRHRKYQKALAKRNPNAVWDENNPDRQSSHLTGATFDVSTKDLTRDEICWLKEYLLELQNLNLIHVRDEFYNNCLHVMVFPVPTFFGDFEKYVNERK
ncbi:MAG: hypothetical protein HYX21_02165 [Candidatus Yanofskybacteria bacterium]|nr:hypothetical protein [Candidatus Yanofskybacteria bacterium]